MAQARLTGSLAAKHGVEFVTFAHQHGQEDGTVLLEPGNGRLIGFIHLGHRGRAPRSFRPLDEFELGLELHASQLVLQFACNSLSKRRAREIIAGLGDYWGLSEEQLAELERLTIELAAPYATAWNPLMVAFYAMVSKARLVDRRGRRNPGKKLAELVGGLIRLDLRGEELEEIAETLSKRQDWAKELWKEEEKLLGRVRSAQVSSSDQLRDELERARRLHWPRLLAVTSTDNQLAAGELQDPAQAFQNLCEGLEFENGYSYLMEPVRLFARTNSRGIEALTDSDVEFFAAELRERKRWLMNRSWPVPYAELALELATDAAELAVAVAERRVKVSRQLAKRFKGRLRKRNYRAKSSLNLWYPPAKPSQTIKPWDEADMLDFVRQQSGGTH